MVCSQIHVNCEWNLKRESDLFICCSRACEIINPIHMRSFFTYLEMFKFLLYYVHPIEKGKNLMKNTRWKRSENEICATSQWGVKIHTWRWINIFDLKWMSLRKRNIKNELSLLEKTTNSSYFIIIFTFVSLLLPAVLFSSDFISISNWNQYILEKLRNFLLNLIWFPTSSPSSSSL